MTYFRIMKSDDLWEGECVPASIGKEAILLVKTNGQISAFYDKCPHQGFPLSSGCFENGTIKCAIHGWEFDAFSGKGINPKNLSLIQLPIKIENGDIFVELNQGATHG